MSPDRLVGFVDRSKPALEAGDYTVTITQTISMTRDPDLLPKMDPIKDEPHVSRRRFTVRGERFALDPGEVVAVFPPANNRGEYANVLPHVVFERKTLPWERAADRTNLDATWLALLLFEADEAPALQPAHVGDLQRDAFLSAAGKDAPTQESTLGTRTACYGDADPDFTRVSGEHPWDPCQVIDVPIDLFQDIAPSVEDLAWLAHVREAPADRKADGGAANVERSVVVGNRLPKPNTTCVVHLVSLEGLAPFLPTADGKGKYTRGDVKVTLADGTIVHAGMIRLVSFKSWSFTSNDPKETFSGYLTHVSTTPPVLVLQRTATDVGGDPGAQATVGNAFALGYTAINHHTRLGDRTVSWYRGPLLPFETSPTIVPPPGTTGTPGPVIATADQAVRYDPATGMMDVSYAVAWETGRLLALASKAFSISLYHWKCAVSQMTAAAVQAELVSQWHLPLADGKGATATNTAVTLLATRLARHVAPAFARSRTAPKEDA